MNKFDTGSLIHSLCRNSALVTCILLPVIQLKDLADGRVMAQRMDRQIAIHCPPEFKSSPREMRRLKRDMWYNFLRYNCLFSEYFTYCFYRLSHRAKLEYVTECEKDDLCKTLSSAETQDIFHNKWKAYQHFAPFYRRNLLFVDEKADFSAFLDFIGKHDRFMVKPVDASLGDGIRIMDAPAAEDAEALFASLRQDHVIVEELIVQGEQMARLHPASVNTVRFTTVLKDGVVHPLFSVLRIGMGNSIVDNAGAGGLGASIDLETGIVTTPGMSKTGHTTVLHPDTGTQIVGMQIPRWEEVLELVSQLAKVVPQQPYVGWDLAFTENGWVMVEGNCAAQLGLHQITTHRGIRPRLSQFLDL